jgi:hypothetical protein
MARSRRSLKLPVQWEDAPDVRKIALELIEAHHGHLRGQPLCFLFRSTAAKDKSGAGRKSRIVVKGPLDIALSADPRWKGHERFYVLEFARTLWHRMGDDEKRYTVDCALSRMIPSPTGGLKIVDLGVADLVPLIGRHGLVDEQIRNLGKAVLVRQHELDFAPEAPAAEEDEDRELAGAGAAVPSGDR